MHACEQFLETVPRGKEGRGKRARLKGERTAASGPAPPGQCSTLNDWALFAGKESGPKESYTKVLRP